MNKAEYLKNKDEIIRVIECLIIHNRSKNCVSDCGTEKMCKRIYKRFDKKVMFLLLDDALVGFGEIKEKK